MKAIPIFEVQCHSVIIMCLDLILSAGDQISKPRSKKRAKIRDHQYLDCLLNFCWSFLAIPINTRILTMSVTSAAKGETAQQARSLVRISCQLHIVCPAPPHGSGSYSNYAFEQKINTDRTLVPPIITARRAVRGIQLQGICETENAGFIQRTQGCSG